MEVETFAQIGNIMYVGGGFQNVQKGANPAPADKIAQAWLAGFDVNTGEWLSSFRPEPERDGLGPAGHPGRQAGGRRRVHHGQRGRRQRHRRAGPDHRCHGARLERLGRLRHHPAQHPGPGQGHRPAGRLALHRRPVQPGHRRHPGQGPGHGRPGGPAAGLRRPAGRRLEAELRRLGGRARRQRPGRPGLLQRLLRQRQRGRLAALRRDQHRRRRGHQSRRPGSPAWARAPTTTSRRSRRTATTSSWAARSTS